MLDIRSNLRPPSLLRCILLAPMIMPVMDASTNAQTISILPVSPGLSVEGSYCHGDPSTLRPCGGPGSACLVFTSDTAELREKGAWARVFAEITYRDHDASREDSYQKTELKSFGLYHSEECFSIPYADHAEFMNAIVAREDSQIVQYRLIVTSINFRGNVQFVRR